MSGEVTANLNTIPLPNLIVLFVGVLVLMVVAAILIKVFNINIGKGSIKVSDYEYDQRCILANHKIKEDIDNIDWNLQKSLREQTKNFNCKILEVGNVLNMCKPAMKSIINIFKDPFYSYISNNHFTREFMPTNYDSYRANLIAAIKNEHANLSVEYGSDKCKNNELSNWSDIEKDVEGIVDDWLIMVQHEVKKACYQKISLYNTEIKNLEKSTVWKGVIEQCVSKNRTYINEIETRLKAMGQM